MHEIFKLTSRAAVTALFIFMAVGYSSAGHEIVYELTLSPQDLSIGTLRGFHTVRLPDCIPTRDVAAPEMPVKVLQFAIPDKNADYMVEILDDEKSVIPGEFSVYPAQASCVTGQKCPFTEPDKDIYQSSVSYPGARAVLVKKGTLMGVDIATVHVYPLAYIPAERQLILHTQIKFRLVDKTIENSAHPNEPDQQNKNKILQNKSRVGRKQTKQFLKKLLANPEALE